MIGVSQPADFTSISVIIAPGINVWVQQRLIWDACCYGKLPECSAVMRQKSKLSTFNGQIWAVFLGNSFYYFYTLDKIGVLMEWISLCAAPFFGRCLHRLGVSSCSQLCSWALSLCLEHKQKRYAKELARKLFAVLHLHLRQNTKWLWDCAILNEFWLTING